MPRQYHCSSGVHHSQIKRFCPRSKYHTIKESSFSMGDTYQKVCKIRASHNQVSHRLSQVNENLIRSCKSQMQRGGEKIRGKRQLRVQERGGGKRSRKNIWVHFHDIGAPVCKPRVARIRLPEIGVVIRRPLRHNPDLIVFVKDCCGVVSSSPLGNLAWPLVQQWI